MEKKNNRFECPEAIIVEFNNDDVIMASGPGGDLGLPGDEWWSGE